MSKPRTKRLLQPKRKEGATPDPVKLGDASKRRKLDDNLGDLGGIKKISKVEEDWQKCKLIEKSGKVKRQKLFHREVEVINKDDDFPLPWDSQHGAFLLGISGKRKSGKTFLSDMLMKTVWKKEFDKIIILSKTAKTKKQQKNYFGTWKGNIQYQEEWTPDFFTELIEEQKQKPGRKILLYIDDMSKAMRERLYSCNIDDFAFTGRHFDISVCWLGQKITLFTPDYRQEADGFILFREENMQELRLLHKEWGFGDLNEFLNMILENTEAKFSWLMIRNEGGRIVPKRLPNDKEWAEMQSHWKTGKQWGQVKTGSKTQ